MRWLVALLLVASVLAGCSSPGKAPSVSGAPSPTAGAAPATNATLPTRLRFAGELVEGTVAIDETFDSINDACQHFIQQCPASGTRTIDLTPIVQPNVPVEVSVTLAGGGDWDASFDFHDAQDVAGTSRTFTRGNVEIGTTLVRASTGTVALVLQFNGIDFANPQPKSEVKGNAHTVTRPNVVPSGLPVAVHLGPGDTLSAEGDGLQQLVAFPPQGPAIRVLVEPFNITVPATGAAGTYLVLATADEAVKLYGPDGTISARLLEYRETAPVDLAPGAPATWDMQLDDRPVEVGLIVQSKDSGAGFAVAPASTELTVSLKSPDNVEVLQQGFSNCIVGPLCGGFTLIGSSEYFYTSDYLDEHLVTGTYHASVSSQVSNAMQAYGWSLTIRSAA